MHISFVVTMYSRVWELNVFGGRRGYLVTNKRELVSTDGRKAPQVTGGGLIGFVAKYGFLLIMDNMDEILCGNEFREDGATDEFDSSDD